MRRCGRRSRPSPAGPKLSRPRFGDAGQMRPVQGVKDVADLPGVSAKWAAAGGGSVKTQYEGIEMDGPSTRKAGDVMPQCRDLGLVLCPAILAAEVPFSGFGIESHDSRARLDVFQ